MDEEYEECKTCLEKESENACVFCNIESRMNLEGE